MYLGENKKLLLTSKNDNNYITVVDPIRGIFNFDIDIIDTWLGDGDGQSVITTIKNVWITQISYNYTSDNWIISDDMQWQAETIYTHYSGNAGSLSRNTGDAMEYSTDRGDYRGSMTTMVGDALINILGE